MKTNDSRVRPMAVVLAGAVSCMLTGCGAASASRGSANASPVARNSANASPGTRTAATPARAPRHAGSPQRGIDMVFYNGNLGPHNTITNEAPGYVKYVKGLGANWLSITFPVFEASRTSSVVVRRSPTPSPADLSIIIKDAQAAGLSIVLRPLLDDANMGVSRVHWTPPNLAQWFASYQRVLIPYAQMAQRDHVQVFNLGVEFDSFAGSGRWNSLDAAIRKFYKGRLSFANNWDQLPGAFSYGGSHVREDVDAYAPMQVPDNASIAVLSRHWTAWASQLRPGTVLGEVGIPAQAGMYRHPYWWKSPQPNAPIVHWVQVKWFTAACNAVIADHLGGIYFWSLGFGSSLTVPSGLANPGSWTASSGATAIARCFAKLKTVR
jgi:hypothetical protein